MKKTKSLRPIHAVMTTAIAGFMFVAAIGTVSAAALDKGEQDPNSKYDDMQFPALPESHQLNRLDIGNAYRDSEGEVIVYVGSDRGAGIAFSLTDIPRVKMTYTDLQDKCAMKGSLWHVPTLGEIERLSPHHHKTTPQFLPGAFWTETQSPCNNCKSQQAYKVVYDVKSTNTLSRYTHPIFKYYGICVKRF